MKRLTIILMLLFGFVWVMAQTSSTEVVRQINAIKMNKDYIAAESTAETSEKAYENARALLEVYIEEWIKSKDSTKGIQGFIAKSGNSILELKTMRGRRYRTFLYVKKSDVMTFSEPKAIIVSPIDSANPRKITVVVSPVETLKKSPTPEVVEQERIYQPNEEEQKMLKVSMLSHCEQFIKHHSKISAYGKYKNIPQSGDCYLFVYNRQGGIPAVLLRTDEGYINVRSGEKDDINNYKGCGAIWFQY